MGFSHYAVGLAPHKTPSVLEVFSKVLGYNICSLNTNMDSHQLVLQGNQHREAWQPEQALACYIQAIGQEHDNPHAWNNYGNVVREMGYPDRAIPFLQQAILLDPTNVTARFNLAVSHLLMGDYEQGWPAYESRWQYAHLSGTFPTWPRLWQGEDVKGQTILIWGEQGLGDCIQFLRFALALRDRGARIRLQVPGMIRDLLGGDAIDHVSILGEPPPDYDYWVPIMSIPRHLNVTVKNLPAPTCYIHPAANSCRLWRERLGTKKRLRVGFSWSGRRDSWINQHKSVPFEQILKMIQAAPQHEWINLQVDCDADQERALVSAGVRTFPGAIQNMSDTAALISVLDVTVSVDTAVSHLSAALGQPTWIMLNHYAVDWRWLLDRADSPWYPTVRLFRQPQIGDWAPVTQNIQRNLDLFKI